MDEQELKNRLDPEEYRVLREGGTEAPFSGEYVDTKEPGVYRCKVCNNVLFSSDHKVDSREGNPGLRGWPSFTDPAVAENIGTRPDYSMMGMRRTEVYCRKCGSHLGHVFDDEINGKERTHYCINSVCLQFDEGDPPKTN